jgi:hypothetical protein
MADYAFNAPRYPYNNSRERRAALDHHVKLVS